MKNDDNWFMSFSKNTSGDASISKVFHRHENGNLHGTNRTTRDPDSSDVTLVVYKCIECQAEAGITDYAIFNASGILKEFKLQTT